MHYMRVFIFASFVALCCAVIMMYTDYLFPKEEVIADSGCPFYLNGCDSI